MYETLLSFLNKMSGITRAILAFDRHPSQPDDPVILLTPEECKKFDPGFVKEAWDDSSEEEKMEMSRLVRPGIRKN